MAYRLTTKLLTVFKIKKIIPMYISKYSAPVIFSPLIQLLPAKHNPIQNQARPYAANTHQNVTEKEPQREDP